MGKFEELEKLQKLKEDGVITQEEFNQEKTKILNGNDNSNDTETTKIDNGKDMLEIRGEFPFVESKIPLELIEGEKVIVQHTFSSYKNANGIVTLTNKRILFNKSKGKTALLGGVALLVASTSTKDLSIEFSQIVSIETPKATMGMGIIKITTNDGYTHTISLQGKTTMHKDGINARDMIAELVQGVINSK